MHVCRYIQMMQKNILSCHSNDILIQHVIHCFKHMFLFHTGCYWHIQHEFVEAERKLLSRSDTELTSRTGYAGGTATDKEGRVRFLVY